MRWSRRFSMVPLMHIDDSTPASTALCRHRMFAPWTFDRDILPRSRYFVFAWLSLAFCPSTFIIAMECFRQGHGFVELAGQIMPEFALATNHKEFANWFRFCCISAYALSSP